MRTAQKLFLLCLAFFALCGFSSKFDIKVLQQVHESPSFELSKSGLLHSDDGVEVNTLLVVQRDKSGRWDYKSPVWAFELTPGSAKPLSKVTYGKAPDGFTEKTKAMGLVRGVHYLVVGLSPGSGGSAEFVAQ